VVSRKEAEVVYSVGNLTLFSRALGITVQTELKESEVKYLEGVEDYKEDLWYLIVVLQSIVGELHCKVKRWDMDTKVYAEGRLSVDWEGIDLLEDKVLDLGMVVDREVESVIIVCNSLELSLGRAGNLEGRWHFVEDTVDTREGLLSRNFHSRDRIRDYSPGESLFPVQDLFRENQYSLEASRQRSPS